LPPAKRTSFPYSYSKLEVLKSLPRLQRNQHELKPTRAESIEAQGLVIAAHAGDHAIIG
jgi:hypothetical protein